MVGLRSKLLKSSLSGFLGAGIALSVCSLAQGEAPKRALSKNKSAVPVNAGPPSALPPPPQIAGARAFAACPQGFADVVAPLLPAVVNVSVIKKVTTYSLVGPDGPLGQGPGGGGGLDDLFRFRDFLERFELAPKKRRLPLGAGSGFIISADGYVVTNAHVVAEADEVIVTLSDQSEHKAKVIGADPKSDIALLKIQVDKPVPYVSWGDATGVRVGDWSIAIGNPLGLGGTVTLGIISYVGRSLAMEASHVGGFFQTDAPINLGNSGGPLLDTRGQVIGVNMMIATPTGGNVGLGFAIPSDVAQNVVTQLKQFGRVKRGYLGVHVQSVNQDIARSLGLVKPTGALVGSVLKDSPADKGLIQQGDVILKVNGLLVIEATKLTKLVGNLPIGVDVPVLVWRKNKKTGTYGEVALTVKIGELEDEPTGELKKQGDEPGASTHAQAPVYGLTFQEITQVLRNKYRLSETTSGLLIGKVDPESRASEMFQPGDVLMEVDQQQVVSRKDVLSLIQAAKAARQPSVLCLIQRSGVPFFVPLSLEEMPSAKKPKAP